MPRQFPLPVLLATLPGAALAHSGHDAGSVAGSFAAGFGHPLGGVDHMLAMVALGLLAAQAGGRALPALPAAFVAAMLAGGAMGATGLPFPAVEPVILASVIILGALVAVAVRPPLAAMLAAAAVFGAAHGWAHGAEAPASSPAPYAAGFAVATAALHGLGILAGRLVPALALRAAGVFAATAGLALAVV